MLNLFTACIDKAILDVNQLAFALPLRSEALAGIPLTHRTTFTSALALTCSALHHSSSLLGTLTPGADMV